MFRDMIQEVKVFAGSEIQSQTRDLGNIVINFVSNMRFEIYKKYMKFHRI